MPIVEMIGGQYPVAIFSKRGKKQWHHLHQILDFTIPDKKQIINIIGWRSFRVFSTKCQPDINVFFYFSTPGEINGSFLKDKAIVTQVLKSTYL